SRAAPADPFAPGRAAWALEERRAERGLGAGLLQRPGTARGHTVLSVLAALGHRLLPVQRDRGHGVPGTLLRCACHGALPGSSVFRQQSTTRDAPGKSRADAAWNSRAASWPGQAAGSSAAGNPGSVNRNLRHSWTSALRSAKTAGSGVSGPAAAIRSPAWASQ